MCCYVVDYVVQVSFIVYMCGCGFSEIIDEIVQVVVVSGVQMGFVNVFMVYISCLLLISENVDFMVCEDLECWFVCVVLDGDLLFWYDVEGLDDMFVYVCLIFIGVSLVVLVYVGCFVLGMWQGLYLWEYCIDVYQCKVMVMVIGGG